MLKWLHTVIPFVNTNILAKARKGFPKRCKSWGFSLYYKLTENKEVVPCTHQEWETSILSDNRVVAQEYVDEKYISTVFLGINHSFNSQELHIFETMVFDENGNGEYCERTNSWDNAINQHKEAVQWARN